MEIEVILTAISTVGFPIVCVIAMAIYVKYMFDKYRAEVSDLNEQHHEEVMNLTEQHRQEMMDYTTALNNNTLALQKLADHLKEGKDE